MKKSVALLVLFLFVSILLVSLPQIGVAEAKSTIYIRAYGSVEGTDKIQRNGDIYTFTSNINDSIVVERDGITIDGAGFTLRGSGVGAGIEMTRRSNIIIKNLVITEFGTGVYIQGSSFNTILGNTILNNTTNGIHIRDQWLGDHGIGSNNNTVSGNNITLNSEYGVKITRHSEQNLVSDNSITKNGEGIYVDHFSINATVTDNNVTFNEGYGIHIDYYSDSSILTGNYVANNGKGIRLYRSIYNLLRDNCMEDNGINLEVFYIFVESPVNDIDTSNTVNGRLVYHWVGEQDKTVPSDAGYVALVNCENIIVQGLTLANQKDGILLTATKNSQIIGNNLKDCSSGVYLDYSSRNITICQNNITDNVYGIYLDVAFGNTVYQNNIANNSIGIYFRDSNNNRIYHNNLINNTEQVDFNAFWMPPFGPLQVNRWDDGYPKGGNYWSDYEGRYQEATELDSSGIWDTPYVLAESNQDNYPLMAPLDSEVILEFPTWTPMLIMILSVTVVAVIYRRRIQNQGRPKP